MRHPSYSPRLLIRSPDTFPGPDQRPFYRENNRSSIFVAFVFGLLWGFEDPLPCHLACLCKQRYQSRAPRYQLLKNQSGQLWPAGSLFCPTMRLQIYDSITDNADCPPSFAAPLALPESMVEVAP